MAPSLILAWLLTAAGALISTKQDVDNEVKIGIVSILLAAAIGIFLGRICDVLF